MERILKYSLLFSIFCFGTQAYGVWNKVGQFNDPIACGYFFDRDNGLIGTGNYNNPSAMNIWWTSDGGKTWSQAKTPNNGYGWVSSIFMEDKLIGYASLYSRDYSVWKTNDGGKSWIDFTQGNNYQTTCFYKTSKAFVKTTWETGVIGGSSINGGRTYSQVFSGGIGHSNGIDFSSDNVGVVSMGPQGNTFNPTTSWFTKDGGQTWSKGNDLQESWGIYAVKGTQKFITVPEGDSRNTNHSVYTSNDGGKNWLQGFSFPGIVDFTGHIAGVGNTIYIQTFSRTTNSGLYRSDDLGATWVNVGGPSNFRDTRFVVTGCRGEVAYAFDEQGGVYKTTDGGDGAFGFTPRIGSIPRVKAGDSVLIPIFLDSTKAPFTISQFTGNLVLNTDLLTPVGFETLGTLSGSLSFDTLYTSADKSFHFLIKFKSPLKNGIALSSPLIYIKAIAYLTKSDTTNVILNSFDINTGAAQRSLIVCSSSSNLFILENECSDSTLREFIKSGTVPQFLSINPNPSSASTVVVRIHLPVESDLLLDILDEKGNYKRSGISYGHYGKGNNSININTVELPSGVYYLRLHLGNGSYLTGRVVITR